MSDVTVGRPIRLTLAGCGAAAELLYLPALQQCYQLIDRIDVTDADSARAAALAAKWPAMMRVLSVDSIDVDASDALIIATPPPTHAAVAQPWLAAGKAVLCEKPLDESVEAAECMVVDAAKTGALLAVNQLRRCFPTSVALREMIRSKTFGSLHSIRYEEGGAFAWPTSSGFYFRGADRKGVLMDRGAHAMDLLSWWLGSPMVVTACELDAAGGGEAQATASMRAGDVSLSLRLSWLTKSANVCVAAFDDATVRFGVYEWDRLTIERRSADGGVRREVKRLRGDVRRFSGFALPVLRNFLAAVAGAGRPEAKSIIATGESVLPSLGAIRDAYAMATAPSTRWQPRASPAPSATMFDAPVVLVVGGGGFIGGRIVERLAESGQYRVRVGLRQWSSAARPARLDVDLALCDLSQPSQIEQAVAGADYVINAAMGDREGLVDGVDRLLACCHASGVKRVVHLSSVEAYGDIVGGVNSIDGVIEVDETTTAGRAGDSYAAMKMEAEGIVRRWVDDGLAACMLRPTVVYGPFSRYNTMRMAERLQSGRWGLLPESMSGLCNLVYVDDVADAAVATLSAEDVVGEAMNINGPGRVSWNDYFAAMNDALELPALKRFGGARLRLRSQIWSPVRVAAQAAMRRKKDLVMSAYERSPRARDGMRRIELALKTSPPPAELKLYQRRLWYSSVKAERLLGIQPAVGLIDGVSMCASWLRHQGLA